MADYHVLTGQHDGNAYTIVHHIPIPATNNRIGVFFQTALVNSGLGGTSMLSEGTGPGQITTAELAQITAGAVYEYVENFWTNPGETAAEIQARLDNRHTELVTLVQQELQYKLNYYGYTRTVP